MLRTVNLAGVVASVLCCGATVYAQGRPAPPPSRYGYALKIDADSMPAKYDGKPHEIKGFIHYHLNDAYDVFYRTGDNNR
jgi:hypothetical protein